LVIWLQPPKDVIGWRIKTTGTKKCVVAKGAGGSMGAHKCCRNLLCDWSQRPNQAIWQRRNAGWSTSTRWLERRRCSRRLQEGIPDMASLTN
jgi:hypothetical protein